MKATSAGRNEIGEPANRPFGGLRWIAAEPYRVFFYSGAVWSVIGVLLWPLFYTKWIGFYPGFAHARLMIEAFGGAFVVGFLGTAGPRMAEAPRFTLPELTWLFFLHQACAVAHLKLQHAWGDALFAIMLGSLLAFLIIRVIRFRKAPPPPQMLLAVTGVICGIVGSLMLLSEANWIDPRRLRLANLLLYQGLLLPPILGIGSFVFPRMLGVEVGDPATTRFRKVDLVHTVATALLMVGSFFVEAFVNATLGYVMRAVVSLLYLLVQVRWKPRNAGSLTAGLLWALAVGWLGLALAPFRFQAQRISVEHLLYIGGFGLLMLVVGSRVLFGHSGDLPGFFAKSNWVRFLVFLGVLAAATRAVPAWVPETTVSHHVYASLTWGLLACLWILWHRKRFAKRGEETG